jgi:Domain of unknown function (DUF1896)
MKEVLMNKLFEYIRDNNPDILIELEASQGVTAWLSDKIESISLFIEQVIKQGLPDYEAEEICMSELTKELKPSKYNYLLNLLEEEFSNNYNQLLESGLLLHKVINMVAHCQPVFDDLNFSEENEDNQFLRYAIINSVNEYLNSENETVNHELQQPTETEG